MKGGTKTRFKDLSIYLKFIITFIFLVMIPCIVWTVVLSVADYRGQQEKERDRIFQMLQLVKTNVELELEKYETKARDIYHYPSIFETYRHAENGYLTNYELMDANVILKGMRSNEEYLHSVCLFFANGQMACGSSLAGFDGSSLNDYEEWFQKAKELNGKGCWVTTFPINLKNETVYSISFCFNVKDVYSSFQDTGIMFANLDIRLLDTICKTTDMGEDAVLFITDADGRIVWTGEKEALGMPLEQFDKDMKNNNDFYSFQVASDQVGWDYVLYMPKRTFNNQAYVVISNNILFLLILFSLFFVCVHILSKNIVKPIQKMTVLTGQIYTPVFEEKMTMTAKDEIGVLANNFLQMKEELLQLIEQIKTTERKEREQAIMALQAQINPHFLYNTLDTVYWMADEKENEEICDTIQALSEILRYSIGKKNTVARIEDEIHNIRNYIYIQKMRFEDLFQVEYDIEEEIYKYFTFKLILQPFVENSILHGFADRNEGGVIKIRGRLSEKGVVFEIEDNGCGMTKERIEFVMSSENSRIGISNIYSRIQYLYGEDYGVYIKSEVNRGTMIRIEIPAIEFNGEDEQQ